MISLDYDKFILRGSTLKNTEWIIGMVVYTGHDTKIMKNSHKTKMKRSGLELLINKLIVVIFLLEIIACYVISHYAEKWEADKADSHPYLGIEHIREKKLDIDQDDIQFANFIRLIMGIGSWLIVLSNLVPISMLVTVEMIKFFQAYFIMWDARLLEEKTGT